MFAKLERIERSFEDLEKELAQPEVFSDQERYRKLAKTHSDMGEICAGTKKGVRAGRRAAVLMGIALDDVMTGYLIYEQALEKKVGVWVQL